MTTHYPSIQEHTQFTTDENGVVTLPSKLTVGMYTLKEIKAPTGYLIAEPITFEVKENADYTAPLVITVLDENVKGRITINKTDNTTKEMLPNAIFGVKATSDIITKDGTVRAKAGDIVDTIVSNASGVATSKDLYLGKYKVQEINAPQGYALNDTIYDVELKYQNQVTKLVTSSLTLTNQPTEIKVEKTEKGSKKPLAGVTYELALKKDTKQNVSAKVEQKANEHVGISEAVQQEIQTTFATQTSVSDVSGRVSFPYLFAGVYELKEVKTLDGYVLDNTVHEIVVDNNGLIEGKANVTLKMENDYTKVTISKLDITTEAELEGATLQILDKDKKVVEEFVSTKEPHIIEYLKAGTYTLKEVIAPDGYLIVKEVPFTVKETGEVQKVVIKDDYTKVSFAKLDADGKPLVEVEEPLDEKETNVEEKKVKEVVMLECK